MLSICFSLTTVVFDNSSCHPFLPKKLKASNGISLINVLPTSVEKLSLGSDVEITRVSVKFLLEKYEIFLHLINNRKF